MDILINELSLHEQFTSIEDFSEKIIDVLRITEIIKELKLNLLKKSDLWNFKPIKDKTLSDILRTKGNDSITKYKSLISSIINNEPFWDLNQKHNSENLYFFSELNVTNTSLAETCEREKLIISFCSDMFKFNPIIITKNQASNINLANFYDHKEFLDWLIHENKISLPDYCFKIFKKYRVDFIEVNKKFLVNELLKELSIDEINTISQEIKKMVVDYLDQGNPLPKNLSKNLRSGIFELRISFGSKICRMLYFYGNDKTIVFTHGFIKKTQITPKNEIDYAVEKKKTYDNSPKSSR